MGTHYKHLAKALLMSTHNICFYEEIRKIIPELSPNTPQPIVVGRSVKGYLANSADPDQMPQNAASDQGHMFANSLAIFL